MNLGFHTHCILYLLAHFVGLCHYRGVILDAAWSKYTRTANHSCEMWYLGLSQAWLRIWDGVCAFFMPILTVHPQEIVKAIKRQHMSEYFYYGMAAVLLTTCWTFAAVRWFHTCPMTNCQGGLLTKHLPEHVLQRFSLIGSKRRDSVLQTPFVDGAYLVGGHLAVTTHDISFRLQTHRQPSVCPHHQRGPAWQQLPIRHGEQGPPLFSGR